jgi:hypothetical protein
LPNPNLSIPHPTLPRHFLILILLAAACVTFAGSTLPPGLVNDVDVAALISDQFCLLQHAGRDHDLARRTE